MDDALKSAMDAAYTEAEAKKEASKESLRKIAEAQAAAKTDFQQKIEIVIKPLFDDAVAYFKQKAHSANVEAHNAPTGSLGQYIKLTVAAKGGKSRHIQIAVNALQQTADIHRGYDSQPAKRTMPITGITNEIIVEEIKLLTQAILK